MKEFSFINSLLKPLAGKDSQGLADDCAWFNGYAITKDILSAGTHFFADDAPYNLARKALRVNLSDLASCGAEPFGFMLGLALPKNTNEEWLVEFTKGLKSDIEQFNFQMLGGDTVYHDAPLTISVTAIGKTEKPVIRSGAKIGDNIFVTEKIGKGFLGLKDKAEGRESEFTKHYELPNPRLDMVPIIRKYANSCIDISDGLLADLWHICEESKLGAEIFSKDVPLAGDADIADLLSGGDDYELCFTSTKSEIAGCCKIGKIIAGNKLLLDGKEIKPKGYQHKGQIT